MAEINVFFDRKNVAALFILVWIFCCSGENSFFLWYFFLYSFPQEPCVSVERLDLRSLCSADFSSWVSVSSLKHPFLSHGNWRHDFHLFFPSIDEETGLTAGEEAVSCQERQNNCTELVQPYLREVQYMFPTTARDVNEMCKVWSQFVDCVRRYVSSCFSDERRTKFNQAVENSVDTVHAICSSDTVQRGQFVWSIHNMLTEETNGLRKQTKYLQTNIFPPSPSFFLWDDFHPDLSFTLLIEKQWWTDDSFDTQLRFTEYLSNAVCFRRISVEHCGNFYSQLVHHVSSPKAFDDHICW